MAEAPPQRKRPQVWLLPLGSWVHLAVRSTP